MSFGYNGINFDNLESVALTDGDISPKVSHSNTENESLSSEQKRKMQLVELLNEEFERFHNFLDDLIMSYHGHGRRRELVTDALGIPDYARCENCVNLEESANGNPICMATGHEEDGETLYKIIPDVETIPSFCSADMRHLSFPEEYLEDVDEWLLEIAESEYEEKVDERRETYEERREQAIEEGREQSEYVTKDIDELIQSKAEYTARELDRLLRSLIDPSDYGRYRRSAIRIAWLRHLDHKLQEDYYLQRAEAYLRALDSRHKSDSLPGEGGDQFEKEVREWLQSWGLPMYECVFELEGVSASHKEMDIHTELPTGDRAIFEVFTSGAHSDKDKQLSDYGKLLELAEGVTAKEILLSDWGLSKQRIDKEFLFDLLTTEVDSDDGVKPPGELHGRNDSYKEYEFLGLADSLSYSEFKPNYQPRERSQKRESQLAAKLRSFGYEPTYPVYRDRMNYGFCGPTIELKTDTGNLTLTFHSGRDTPWEDDGSRNERMFESGDKFGFDWIMDGHHGWHSALSELKDNTVAVIEVADMDQSRLHTAVLDGLFRAK